MLFNCAGYVHAGTILDCDEEDWDFSFDAQRHGDVPHDPRLLAGHDRGGGGSIINMSSVASSVNGVPNRFAYGATKAAVIGLTKSVAADFVASGIRCNAICPGTVDTPSLRRAARGASGDYERRAQEFVARQPWAGSAGPKKSPALAVYLASDESGFTTGATHVIDGGFAL